MASSEVQYAILLLENSTATPYFVLQMDLSEAFHCLKVITREDGVSSHTVATPLTKLGCVRAKIF